MRSISAVALVLALSAGFVVGFHTTGLTWLSKPSMASPRAQTVLRASAQLSRFERQAQNWKGALSTVTDPSEAGFSYDDFKDFLDEQSYNFNRGDVVQGTVMRIDAQGVHIDIGAKAAAFMPLREASLMPIESLADLLDVGETRDFQIITDENDMGQLQLSIRRMEFFKAWDKLQELHDEDAAFDATALSVNRGGVILSVMGLRGFLPGSHLCGALPTDDLIGQTLRVKFLELNQENNKIILSNRRAVVEDQMQELKRGDVLEGVVKAIKPYGAFVEVMGMSGLLHISQISYDRIEDISAVVQPNTMIKCMIIDHDKVNGRIALSTKTLEPEPGDMMKDPARVFELAEETAKKYHERMEAERKAREEAAKDIVMGLGDDLDSSFGSNAGSSSGDIDELLTSMDKNPTAAATEEKNSDDLDSILGDQASE